MTTLEWDAGQAITRWGTGLPRTEWIVANFTVIGLSQLATEYILVPVSVTKLGLPFNPTGDTVQFAFMPTPTQVPQVTDWVAGVWETDTTNVLYPYACKCLVGPTGTITLGVGTYIVYIRVVDNPEIPVLIGGQLQIS